MGETSSKVVPAVWWVFHYKMYFKWFLGTRTVFKNGLYCFSTFAGCFFIGFMYVI